MTIWPGRSYPLGATWDGARGNLSSFSEHATCVELCRFDSADAEKEGERIKDTEQTDIVRHVHLSEAEPGQLYGYQVHALHSANLEVILAVVYNHTGEGNQMGRRSHRGASTMRSATGSHPIILATTWIPRAAATRTRCRSPAFSN